MSIRLRRRRWNVKENEQFDLICNNITLKDSCHEKILKSKKINAVHERSLRIIRNDYESLYPLLLEEAHQITFHQRCINSFMIDVYKYLNVHSPDIMNDAQSSRQKILLHWNTDSMLFHIVLANSGIKCLLISVRQLL